MLLLGLIVASTLPPQEVQKSVADLAYPSVTLDKNTRFIEWWYEVPGHWVFSPSQLSLSYSFAPSEAPQRGLLLVRVNGQVADRIRLHADGEDYVTTQVDLPIAGESPQGLHVKLEYYPGGNDLGCDQPDERAITVHNTSAFELRYRFRDARADLRALPYPFAYAQADHPIETLVVIPDDISETLLTALARTSHTLGRWADLSPLSLRVVSSHEYLEGALDGRPVNVIAVGPDDSLREVLQDLRLNGGGSGARIELQVAHWNPANAVLWIGGRTPEDVLRAALALETSPETRGPTLTVPADEPSTEESPEEDVSPWAHQVVSLKDLDISTFTIRGERAQTHSLYLRRPLGWKLDDDSTLTLNLSVPDPKIFDSTLTVELNGKRAGRVSLDELDGRSVEIALPNGDALNRDE
ncbi:MAG: cellulose biosynthesis cyclic di-GMP-binding regulatory protein BcsB, partial [Myxococcota bacterium]